METVAALLALCEGIYRLPVDSPIDFIADCNFLIGHKKSLPKVHMSGHKQSIFIRIHKW